MKNLLYLSALIITIGFSSCEKEEEIKPLAKSTPKFRIDYGYSVPKGTDEAAFDFVLDYEINGEKFTLKNKSVTMTKELPAGTKIKMTLKTLDKKTGEDKTGSVKIITFVHKDYYPVKENLCFCNGNLDVTIE